MNRIEELFKELQERYGLSRIKLIIDKDFCDRKECGGIYSTLRKDIHLCHSDLTPFNVATLLHEVCHAIQDKEGRLPRRSTLTSEQIWELEKEAYLFAQSQLETTYSQFKGRIFDFDKLRKVHCDK
jgi:Zn-dependent peptidase ImmA (M78 family)